MSIASAPGALLGAKIAGVLQPVRDVLMASPLILPQSSVLHARRTV